jgi:hypothetical protein
MPAQNSGLIPSASPRRAHIHRNIFSTIDDALQCHVAHANMRSNIGDNKAS